MKRLNSSFSTEQIKMINSKNKKYRLYYALMFKYYEINNSFFEQVPKCSHNLVSVLMDKFNISSKLAVPSNKPISIYKKEIRSYFQISVATVEDEECIKNFIIQLLPSQNVFNIEFLKERVRLYLIDNKIEQISAAYAERIIKSVIYNYEQQLFARISDSLCDKTRAYLDGLMLFHDQNSIMAFIKSWVNGISLQTILIEADKLAHLQCFKLPQLLEDIPDRQIKRYYRDISTKYPYAIKTMPEEHRYAFLSIFCFVRQREITDNLTDLLIRLTHKIFTKGEKKIKKSLSKVTEIKKIYDNKETLKLLVDTILSNKNVVVKQAIFPVISENELEAIQSELNTTTESYDDLVYNKARKSYIHHYRRMLIPVLELLEFCSNNKSYQPIIEAVEVIKSHAKSQAAHYPENIVIPVDGAVKKIHTNFVIDTIHDKQRINRVNYELSVLFNLRNKLRVKEVWITNAKQYRNPEKDLPQDFEVKRKAYYALLEKPVSARLFITTIQKHLKKHLSKFNESLPKNQFVSILKRPKGHIKVAKLEEQSLPPQLEAIKLELIRKWPSVNLLDILKETDLFVGFLKDFIPSGSKEGLDRETITKRLLLAILGYGTNAGLKSMSIGNEDVSYQELKHIKLRYFDADNFRNAIRKIINNLLNIRMPEIWGNCTTAVASDGKHFKVSDQNLMSRWHPRYHSNGVIVYWHVSTKAVCIYSQLKSCASSEVASMIEGILKHCTKMNIDQNYVDTHGASEVGFAFAYMLNFSLLPRLKNIHLQKLYGVESEDKNKYKNLTAIISKPVNWDIIEKYYDQIVKYTIALKQGTASAENILQRFTRNNLQNPTYKALSELGKAIKTIFLCRYLSSKSLRQEIHSGLNVVENWNGVNDFIFYGKNQILQSNNPAELELSMLCLHLLQLSIVYINTLLLQQVLVESRWLPRLTLEDKRAITPLIYEHINPYGEFPLDMGTRLAINPYARSKSL